MYHVQTGNVAGADRPDFARKVFSSCGKWGYTHGGTAEIQQRAVSDLVAFFRENLSR